jgi:hypothetical protein
MSLFFGLRRGAQLLLKLVFGGLRSFRQMEGHYTSFRSEVTETNLHVIQVEQHRLAFGSWIISGRARQLMCEFSGIDYILPIFLHASMLTVSTRSRNGWFVPVLTPEANV